MAYLILFSCAAFYPIFVWQFSAKENEAADNLFSDFKTGKYLTVIWDMLVLIMVSGVCTFFIGGFALVIGGGIGEMILGRASDQEHGDFDLTVRVLAGSLWVLTAGIMLLKAAERSGLAKESNSFEMPNHEKGLRNSSPPARQSGPSNNKAPTDVFVDQIQFMFHPVDRIKNEADRQAMHSFRSLFGESHDICFGQLARVLKAIEEPVKREAVFESFTTMLAECSETPSVNEHLLKFSKALSIESRSNTLNADTFLDAFATSFNLHHVTYPVLRQLHSAWDELNHLGADGQSIHDKKVIETLTQRFCDQISKAAPSVNWMLRGHEDLIVYS